jgi:hypothetical protein
MKMLSVDRIETLRVIGADAATLGSARTVPQATATHAPVKVRASAAVEPTPSLVNKIGQLNKAASAGVVYANLSGPAMRASGSELAPYDWSLSSSTAVKVEDKPPLTDLLIEHLKSLWLASAMAIQTQQPKDEKLAIKSEAGGQTKANAGISSGLAMLYSPSQIKIPLIFK